MENNIIHTAITKSGKTISFRYPTIDDAEILKNYINKISAEKSFLLMQGVQKTIEDEQNWLKSFIENKNKKVIILAIVDEKIVGISDVELKSDAKCHVGSFGISIDIDYRGDGIGKELMEVVIEESIEKLNGLKIIELEVFGQNKIAQNLYKKMGFIEYGRLPKSLKRRGKFDDAILMYKKINRYCKI